MPISKWLANLNKQNEEYERDVIFRNVGNNPHTPIDPKTGKILVGNEVGKTHNTAQKKMTPAEKIASVHIEVGKDNVLPELNEEDLIKIGADKNKPVLVKANVIDKNAKNHPDIPADVIDSFIGKTLYSKDKLILPGKYPDKPYFVFFLKTELRDKKGGMLYETLVLDVTERKDNFEVVHWHWAKEGDMPKISPGFKQ